ncbi:MAG TPA: sulfatase [Gemmatimonadales bacterium]|nr:sulfatase [Gemmatimonadales bacterium]
MALSTLLLVSPYLVFGPAPAVAQAEGGKPPNLLILVADDLGWRDLGTYGNAAVRTPNLDRLARSGLRVVHAFGTSPQCSPSRISTLTGKYAHATRTEDLHTPLLEGERILPSYLHAQGYFTGMLAKRHIGVVGDRQFQWYSPGLADVLPAFLDSAGTRPFLLWVGFHDPHRPYVRGEAAHLHAPSRVVVPPYLVDSPETRADLALYYDEIARMDHQIGRMLAELERRKLRENTLVVFFSDNGAPFPREKGTLYDAGTRTPLIFSWPGTIPAGSLYQRGLVSLIDVTPTLLELTGTTPPPSLHGRSFQAILTRPDTASGRSYVFSERNWHDCDEHQRAVRSRRFKLIRTDAYTDLPLCITADIGASLSFRALQARAAAHRLTVAQQRLFESPRPRLELYDLERDPWELHNVAADARYAGELGELAGVLQQWIEESDDFPAAFRVRDDNTDRITGVPFSSRIPPIQNDDVPPAAQRWGKRQSELGM